MILFFVEAITIQYWVYMLAALLPAVVLLRYIYKKDTVEKEPAGLLLKLLMLGVLAALLAIILETIGENVLGSFVLSRRSPMYTILLAFLVVGCAEEFAKYFLLYKATWNHPAFNYMFDAIVYAVFVSLGFAAFENVMYVFTYGLGVALSRAFLSIPGHMAFAVVFGYYYGRAKRAEVHGGYGRAKTNILKGYVLAVLAHGFYDTCAMMGTPGASLLFFAFVIFMYWRIYHLIRKESAEDEPL